MNEQPSKLVYWNPYVAGLMLGLVLFLSYVTSGAGLGGSGGISRFLAFGVDQVDKNAVDHNAYLAHLAGGSANPLDHRMAWMLVGVVLGGFVSGLAAGRLSWETYKGPRIGNKLRWTMAFAGGSLMGFGAAMARGCTSGQALSGGAVLSVGSWAFMMMVFGGAYFLAYPFRKLWLP